MNQRVTSAARRYRTLSPGDKAMTVAAAVLVPTILHGAIAGNFICALFVLLGIYLLAYVVYVNPPRSAPLDRSTLRASTKTAGTTWARTLPWD